MSKLVTPFRVGLLVLVSGAFLFMFVTFARKGGLSESEAISVHAYFRDAAGLSKKSSVQIAGITVGEITAIRLEGIRARVDLKIRRDVGLRADAMLSKRSESLLGDYLLDLQPGSDTADPMPENGEITRVVDTQGMQQVFSQLEGITKDIKSVTGSLSGVLGGQKGQGSMQEIMENMIQLSASINGTVQQTGKQLDEILNNFAGVSEDVRDVTQGQQAAVEQIVRNLEVITRDVRDVLATFKGVIGSEEGDLKEGVASIKSSMERLDRSLANIEEITEKVKNGQGPAARLLTDERLGQKLGETIEDVSDFASRLTRLKTEVGIRSEYLFAQGQAKNFLSVRLIPKPDKYYLLEFVDDPRGVVDTVVLQSNPPTTGDPVTQVQKTTREGIKFSAQFAKRYYFTTLRFGIIESTGGIGADLHAFSDMFTLKVDAFNFSVAELRYPRMRAALRFQPTEHIFATVGMDDMLNRQVRDTTGTNRLLAGRDFFMGLGVSFTDEDLTSLLTVAPIPTP